MERRVLMHPTRNQSSIQCKKVETIFMKYINIYLFCYLFLNQKKRKKSIFFFFFFFLIYYYKLLTVVAEWLNSFTSERTNDTAVLDAVIHLIAASN